MTTHFEKRSSLHIHTAWHFPVHHLCTSRRLVSSTSSLSDIFRIFPTSLVSSNAVNVQSIILRSRSLVLPTLYYDQPSSFSLFYDESVATEGGGGYGLKQLLPVEGEGGQLSDRYCGVGGGGYGSESTFTGSIFGTFAYPFFLLVCLWYVCGMGSLSSQTSVLQGVGGGGMFLIL